MTSDTKPDLKQLTQSVLEAFPVLSFCGLDANNVSSLEEKVFESLGIPSDSISIDTETSGLSPTPMAYYMESGDLTAKPLDLDTSTINRAKANSAIKNMIGMSAETRTLMDEISFNLNPTLNAFDALLAHIIQKIKRFSSFQDRVLSCDLMVAGPVYRFSFKDSVVSQDPESFSSIVNRVETRVEIVCFKTDSNRILTYSNFTYSQVSEFDIADDPAGISLDSYTDEEHLCHDYLSFVRWFDDFL